MFHSFPNFNRFEFRDLNQDAYRNSIRVLLI